MITNTELCQSLSAEEIIILMKKLGATDYQDNGDSIWTICMLEGSRAALTNIL